MNVSGFLEYRFVRFLLVGTLNTLFGYVVFSVALFCGAHYAAAAAVSTIAAVFFNFLTTGRLVFENRDPSRLLRFIGVYTLTYVLGVACLKVGKELGGNLYLVSAGLLLPMATISFLLNKTLVFGARE